MKSQRPNEVDLGDLASEYGLNPTKRRVHYLLAGTGTFGFMAFTAFGLYRLSFALQRYGPRMVARWSLPWFGIAGIFLLMAIVGLALLVRWRNYSVAAYQAGLRVGRGFKTEILFWHQIAEIRTTVVRYGIRRRQLQTVLTLFTQEGKKLRFTEDLTGLNDLIRTVKSFVYPRLLAQFNRKLREDEDLQFGPLTLTRRGIHYDRQGLAWGQVGGVAIQNGSLQIYPADGIQHRGISLPSHRIPNVDLCLQLIRHMKGAN